MPAYVSHLRTHWLRMRTQPHTHTRTHTHTHTQQDCRTSVHGSQGSGPGSSSRGPYAPAANPNQLPNPLTTDNQLFKRVTVRASSAGWRGWLVCSQGESSEGGRGVRGAKWCVANLHHFLQECVAIVHCPLVHCPLVLSMLVKAPHKCCAAHTHTHTRTHRHTHTHTRAHVRANTCTC